MYYFTLFGSYFNTNVLSSDPVSTTYFRKCVTVILNTLHELFNVHSKNKIIIYKRLRKFTGKKVIAAQNLNSHYYACAQRKS